MERKALFDDDWEAALNEVQRRRMLRFPYSADRDGRFTKNGKLVNDGGYRDGILVDAELEEEEYGPMTDADYEVSTRVADHFGVEPRILN